MALTPKQIINRAFRLAVGTGQDPHSSPAIDNIWVFEEAFPLALNKAVEEIGYGPSEIEHYRRVFTLTLASGSAAMPQDVLHQFLDRSTLSSADDDTIASLSSFCNRFSEFANPPHDALHYYTTVENTFRFRQAGTDIDAFDGDIDLYAIAVPAIPATLTTTMTAPDDIVDRTVEILAGLIQGRAVSA